MRLKFTWKLSGSYFFFCCFNSKILFLLLSSQEASYKWLEFLKYGVFTVSTVNRSFLTPEPDAISDFVNSSFIQFSTKKALRNSINRTKKEEEELLNGLCVNPLSMHVTSWHLKSFNWNLVSHYICMWEVTIFVNAEFSWSNHFLSKFKYLLRAYIQNVYRFVPFRFVWSCISIVCCQSTVNDDRHIGAVSRKASLYVVFSEI